MRHLSTISALLCAFFCMQGCTPERSIPQEDSRALVLFTCSQATKAEGLSAIGHLDALVFRADGALDASFRSSGEQLAVRLSRGLPLRWYIIANAPESLRGVVSEADLLSRVSLLEDSSASRPVMRGCGSGVIREDTTVPVSLDRMICKVTLGSVRAPFLADDFMESEAVLRGVFLLNACGSCPYRGSAAEGVRHNRTDLDTDLPGSLQSMLSYPMGTAVRDEAVMIGRSLYCCPDPWGKTSLVIRLDIRSVPNYYRAELPAMQCNTEYIVREIVLVGPGAITPGGDADRTPAEFTVRIVPWDDQQREISFE